MKKIIATFLVIFSTQYSAFAADKPTNWKIDYSKSKIEFIADQNNSKINGSFAKFSGTINFSKTNLAASNADILINLDSVNASMNEAPSVLKEDGWFGVKKFPTAKFKSQKFTQLSDNKFRLDGFLTLKGVKMPLAINFSFNQYSPNLAVVVGETTINRLDFGVGKKDENSIKDAVSVKFTITANS